MSLRRVALSKALTENVLHLPGVPLPTIAATSQRYLDSLRAVKSSESIAAHQAKMETFLQASGRALQQQLESREPAYAAGAVLTERLLSRAPVQVQRNPGFVLKRECLQGATDGTQAGVAAALIHGVGCWIRDAVREGVPASGSDGAALDIRPLAEEFGRSLLPAKDRDRVETVPLDQLRHVIVLHDGHANLVRVLDDTAQHVQDRGVIQRALEVILSTTPDQDNPAPVSVLTAGSRAVWGQAYSELVRTPENAETLRLFQEGILVVCLDSKPWSAAGGVDVRGCAVLHGRTEEAENRWYDKHQLIVSADGQAGFNFEASSSGAPHWGRWIEEVLATATASGAGSAVVAEGAVSSVLRPLVVTYGKSFASHIRAARQEAVGLVTSTEGFGVSLPLGSSELSRVGLTGDAFVQLALHLAHHRRRECLCPTSAVVSMAEYYGGLTDMARTATPEVLLMCESFKQHVKPGEGLPSSTKREELGKLVRAAAARHAAVMQAVAAGEGVDRHLLVLQRLADECRDEASLAFFADSFYQSSTRFLVNSLEFSRPWLSLVAVGPSDSRGCGVGYTIDTSETRLHVATSANSPLCSCEEYSQCIVTAAMDIYRIAGGTSI